MELLLGCGNSREKRVKPAWRPEKWEKLVTLDISPYCGADIVADLEDGLPFRDEIFDEIHVYEVLEHLGQQGDYRAFFRDFGEITRVLKVYGIICGTSPHWNNRWAWGDPGHRRIISYNSLSFLNQEAYIAGVGATSMTDYRWLWKHDLRQVWAHDQDDSQCWILQKHPRAS